jgi:hypothetical protein
MALEVPVTLPEAFVAVSTQVMLFPESPAATT